MSQITASARKEEDAFRQRSLLRGHVHERETMRGEGLVDIFAPSPVSVSCYKILSVE